MYNQNKCTKHETIHTNAKNKKFFNIKTVTLRLHTINGLNLTFKIFLFSDGEGNTHGK